MDPSTDARDRFSDYAGLPAEQDLFTQKVRVELSRLLASSQFQNSKRLRDFLSFTVETVLQGNASHLKESLIGVQVFERQPGFDPKQDPVVRVTARRLREKLDEFYSSEGRNSEVLIQLAKGTYIPKLVDHLQRQNGEPEQAISTETEAEEGQPEVLNVMEEWLPAAPTPPRTRGFNRLPLGAVAGSLALLLLGLTLRFRPPHVEYGSGPVSHFNIDLPPDQELRQDYGRNLAFSPDGRSLVYVARQNGAVRLFFRDLSESQSRAIPDSEGAAAPLFSPDGVSIVAYVPGRLRRFVLKGGHVDLTTVSPELALFGSAWEGSSLLYDDAPPEVLNQGLASIYRWQHGRDSERVRVTSRPRGMAGDESQIVDQSLPDGKGYLISIHGAKEWIAVVSPDGSRKRIVSEARGGIYMPTGHLAFWSNGKLQVAPINLGRLELTGPSVTALKNVGSSGWEGAEVAVSPQGTLAYVERSPYLSDRQLVWVDRTGKQTPLPIPPVPISPLSFSPNGKNLLLARYDRGEQEWALLNYSISDGSSRQLTEPSRNPPYACWSPDGRFIVYESNRISGRASNLFVRSAIGGAQDAETQITWFKDGGMVPYLWSKDGKWIVGTRGMLTATKSDIYAVPVPTTGSDKRAPIPVVQTPDYDNNPDLSPDGRWLAYQTEGRIFVRRFPGVPDAAPALVGEGEGPLWDASGRKLYFRRTGSVMEMPVSTDPSLQFGPASTLFASEALRPDLWIRNTLLTPDGKRFLMVIDERDKTEGHRINVVVNWFAEVQRLFLPQDVRVE